MGRRTISEPTTPRMLIENVSALVSLPEIYLRLQEVIEQPEHTRRDVAGVVMYDPSLSARVLRIANSSFYGFASKVGTIEAAVSIIGELELSNMVLAASVADSMNRMRVAIDLRSFWTHSLRCGIVARMICKRIGNCSPETAFLAGMLHDLGVLITYHDAAELARAIDAHISTYGVGRDTAERELLGFDHAEVGALLSESWSLPAALSEMILSHHNVSLATTDQRSASVLALANQFSQADFEPDNLNANTRVSGCRQKLMDRIGLDPGRVPGIVESAKQQSNEIQSMICG